MTTETVHGITDVAALTGLSKDTLRWYEREGLIPAVGRDTAGRRRYDDASVRMLQLLVRLRRTGMPVARMKQFADLVEEGAASHGRRLTLLTEHRDRVLEHVAALQEDLAAVEDKMRHYQGLIAAGLDCTSTPIDDPDTLNAQRSPR